MKTLKSLIVKNMKVSKLKRNPNNPRQIKAEKLDLLKKSVTEFEKMMELRPMIVDENKVVLGGNMRLEAIKSLGLKEVPDSWIKRAENLTEDEKREFVIKDNNSFGEYDWDLVANGWDDLPLADWATQIPLQIDINDDDFLLDAPKEKNTDAENNKQHKCPSCGYEF